MQNREHLSQLIKAQDSVRRAWADLDGTPIGKCLRQLDKDLLDVINYLGEATGHLVKVQDGKAKLYETMQGIEFEVEYVSYESVTPIEERPARSLTCCCCGELTIGRQWWNRDNGFGLCNACAERISEIEDEAHMESCYGKKGIHYALKQGGVK